MPMTKKDFQSAAESIAKQWDSFQDDVARDILLEKGLDIAAKKLTTEAVTDLFVDFFRSSNSRFDEARFRSTIQGILNDRRLAKETRARKQLQAPRTGKPIP